MTLFMRDWSFYNRLAIPCDRSDRELVRACHECFGPSYRTRLWRSQRHAMIYKMLQIHHSMQLTR